MADLSLDEALDHCIDRLNAGATVADCLAEFPQHAAALETLLESGLVLRGAQADDAEAIAARERQRLRFEGALQRPSTRPSRPASSRLLSLVASVALVSLFFLGGAGILAENSIPGDPLYGLKRWTETLRLNLIPDPTLMELFAQRRIDETQQVIDQRRVTDVQFVGIVESVSENSIVMAGLEVILPEARADIVPGTRLELRANSDAEGRLTASEIRFVEAPPPTALPPSATANPTETATLLPSDTPTSRPSATERPTDSASPTQRISPSPTRTPDPCDTPTLPAGWLEYDVQPGDTASALAASTGLTLNEFAAANCLDDVGSLIVGQPVYLPYRPPTAIPTLRPSATPQVRPSQTAASDRPQQRPTEVPSRRDNDGSDEGDEGNNSDGGDRRRG